RKMLVAMAQDVRVVLIKLADRLHNMLTLEALPGPKRRAVAEETREIYAPLAHRLGIWTLKWQLEDLAFRYLEPVQYREIAHFVAMRRAARERFIARVSRLLKEELGKASIVAVVSGRPKHLYSIHLKREKYLAQGKDLSDIHDLFAMRIIVEEVADCYNALGAVHTLWRPIPGQFDDFIANPKGNMYRSLHTTVIGPRGKPLEVQIRTQAMHQLSEYGIAAHWKYKEGAREDLDFDEKLSWLRQLMEWHRGLGTSQFVESVKTDIFRNQVFVFTPKGEIKDLPSGATAIDFAYRVHTEVGHRCIGAKVNGKLMSLNHPLQNGDVVEILTSRSEKGPSRDWLNPHLGYVRTSHAREKIRQWFWRLERTANIEKGKELVEKELRRLAVSLSGPELAHLFQSAEVEDFYLAVGCGDITPHQIALKLAGNEERLALLPHPSTPVSPGIQVLGVGDLVTQLSRCCSPLPGNAIIGYITRNRGVSIHRQDCPNMSNLETQRLIAVEWDSHRTLYPVGVCI
ncbi:MAG TPA: bifunctional (p)ppGpp synthetase/guanosine-3',5'-bis(diphosphate) 3'-pyrophosphohydrolase, partial [Dehalococcoidia bacterium]|nr:bifunctional (p)ppGpp synthetase/guanosine-3',5'-bis(diphosphate) 3'-pyrophosphohydrolase [Dehalococcoidia bacterium]